MCKNCDKEFELEYRITENPPTLCPLCGFDGKVERLIQLTAPGRCPLTGHDLKQQLISEGRSMARSKDENFHASVAGEDVHHETVSWSDKLTSDLKGV